MLQLTDESQVPHICINSYKITVYLQSFHARGSQEMRVYFDGPRTQKGEFPKLGGKPSTMQPQIDQNIDQSLEIYATPTAE